MRTKEELLKVLNELKDKDQDLVSEITYEEYEFIINQNWNLLDDQAIRIKGNL